MASRIRRELADFPFGKLYPADFRTQIASIPERDLEKHPVRVWVETENIAKVIKLAGSARVLRVYPHLNYVLLQTYASELAGLVASDLVRSVWNDMPLKAEGPFAVPKTSVRPGIVEAGIQG